MRRFFGLLIVMLFICLPALALGQSRALLVACHDFISMPTLGNAVSGNLHIIGSSLVGAGMSIGSLSIEDGTIGSTGALTDAVKDAFSDATEYDLSILYLCTHGVLSSSDDGQVYLLLGDGKTEAPLNAQDLQTMLSSIQGEKLLIIDACYSGALIGHGVFSRNLLPGARNSTSSLSTPFLADSSIHVLTSASGFESSWYYDSKGLSTGAVSYFASAIAGGLGLYGVPEADLNGDSEVTLEELYRYLGAAVPSSSVQLLSSRADGMMLPISAGSMLSRSLSAFTYGDRLLSADDPTLDFSYTVTRQTAVQYRVVSFANGSWDWSNATTFLDEGDNGDGLLQPGRKTRELTLDGVVSGDSGYVMLQVFAVTGDELLLCSERLLAIHPEWIDPQVTLRVQADAFDASQLAELPIEAYLNAPAEITVSVFNAEGELVRRLASSQMTRPTPGNITRLYWDGRGDDGAYVPAGRYTLALETLMNGERQKATAEITVL